MPTHSLFSDAEIPRPVHEVLPGVVHTPGWLTMDQQNYLVWRFFEWGERGAAGQNRERNEEGQLLGIPPHQPEIFGKPMSVRLTSLGWHWSNYEYTKTAPEFGGATPLPVPDWLVRLGRRALAVSFTQDVAPSWPKMSTTELDEWADSYTPDMALINFYAPSAHMGMHQDKEERSGMPVVSLSIGDTGIFRAGNTLTKNKPYTDLSLASGDLIVFGGPSRFMYHGVPKILGGTAPSDCLMQTGRINITLRMTGL